MSAGTGTPPDAGRSRASFRVTAELPIRYRSLSSAEAERLSLEIAASEAEQPEIAPALALRLQALERKLDLVLHHLDPSLPPPLSARDALSVGISASGLALAAKQALRVDSFALVELLLPGPAARELRAVARVVRCQEKRGPEPALLLIFAFSAIHSEDREAIVRFGNELQRAELRRRSAARDA